MASASGGAGVWRITGEDRAKHDSQFYQLKPVNGFVTGEQAKNFFMQSGLPTPVLGQIWSLADFNNDGKMDRKEFSIAMYLIKKKLQGFELPKSLPASLKMDPSPVMGSFGTMQSGAMSMGPTPPMGATPPMAAPGMGTPPMNMGMPIMSMAPTSMTASSLAMPIMANGVTPAMGQTNFMGVPPPMGSPATMMDTKPRSGSFNTPMPGVGPSPAGTFAMPHQNKLKYTQVFNTNDRNKRGHLTGVEARALLVQLGLPQPILAQIWALSDIDKDGKLTCDEFCIAMFLCDLTKTGVALPAVLPAELMPNKARSGSFGPAQPPPQVAAPQNDSFGDLLGGMGMAPPPIQPLATNGESKDEEDRLAAMVTFEDRRKENFAKGQAELDRRRQMLQDQMKRENEARLEKERQEQEKRERYRQEQERKRQMELERHMEKQRQMEREREEQRQKMLEQREAARRELERQRQVEWERQRKEQLLAEKGREYEQLGAVKSRASNLRCELESLQGKKSEIDQKIIKVRQGVTDFTTNIEAMRIIRDGKINDIDKIEKDIKNLSDRLLQVQTERESLDYRVQTTSQSNPLSEPHRTVLHAVELKKTAIQKLKKELQDIERDTESNLVEIDNSNAEMTEMNSKINSLQQDISSLQRQQNQKQAETSQVKRQLEEEAQNRKKQEKEKQEKLRKELEAQRLKEQEKKKKEETSQDSAWFAFGNDNKPATSANNDIWSSAFASVQSETSSTTDTWASAFSSQSQNAPAAQSSSASKKGRNFKALYPFDARNPDELNLNPGDIVWIPDDQSGADDGWMSGEKNGKKGWFPKDYVEAHPESESSQAATDAFSDNTSTEQPANFGRFDGIDESPFESSSASPTPGQGQTAPDGLQAQVLYPWKAKKDNHLSFNKGDIINVKEQQELWWFGELSGQTGWFPKSYVKLVSGPATTNSSKQSSRSGTPQTNAFAATASSSSRSTPVVIEPKLEEVSEAFVAIFSYTSTEPGDLVFNQGDLIMVTKKDGDWWTGSLGDTTGIFPANYVKKSEQLVAQPPQPATPPVQQPQQSLSANAQPQQQSQQKTSTSSTLKKPEIASVIAAYSATGPEQLSLQPGQIIQVRKKSPSGWWEGELQARGQKRKIGWFPANYVKLLGSSARSTPDSSSQRNSPANTLSRSATPSIPPPQPQSIQTESKYVDQVIALYPYVPQHDDELTFHKDAVINVINKDDANWWKGEVNGVVGLFPANYVGPLTLSPPQENTWSSDPDVLAQTSAIESKRQNYIHELINTEETYMSDMSIVLDAFRKPMSEAKVMTEEELETVFVNWTELILCNTKLLKSVRVRKKMCGKGQVIQVIGDILCENLPHMTAYIRFCSCQLNAAALIQRKTENSPEFKEIQKKCVQDNRTKGMPLSSFLLKPMQRITKYPLMIQKILQYTPEGHPDHQNLQDALAKAEELCSQVNEGVRERENCDKLEWIQSRVQCDGLTEKLVFNSITNCLGPRKLLYTSTVYKAKSNKELVAFLFNDFLLLTVPLSSSASTFVFDPKTKSQFKMYKNPIFLNEIMVKKVGEEDGEPFIFQVSMVDNRTYNLKASNQTERDSWVRHTEAASRLYLDTEKKKKESAYSLRRITGVGRLLVVLLEGCDLIASDANGKSDPYCEVSMGVQEHKTKVINATLNPKWNTSMQFTIKDVEQDVLCITVFDRDLFSPNDFLGRTEVRVKDIMVESKQRKGPITKRLLLHEVSKGEVVVKLDLQLYDNT